MASDPGSDIPAAAASGAAPDAALGAAPGKPLSEAARRALAEAAERRRLHEAAVAATGEQGGPAGPEPTRYGDWERKGVAIDFS